MSSTGATAEIEADVSINDELNLKQTSVTSEVATALEVETGDPVILTVGDDYTVAEVARVTGQSSKQIVVDSYTGGAIGIRERGTCTVSQTDVVEAEEVTYENTTLVSEDDTVDTSKLRRGIKSTMKGKFVALDDRLTVRSDGDKMGFKLTSVDPDIRAVRVTNSTHLILDVVTREEMQSVDLNELPVEDNSTSIKYDDLGGLSSEIEKVRELAERPLLDPEAFKGVDAPTGVLLYGPPGTGKTMLAEAAANEADITFRSLTGSSIFSRYYGESEENLRKLFDYAKQNEPAIIFIDEFDSLAPDRSDLGGGEQTESRVVNQLKTLMSEIGEDDRVVVLAATNDKDSIDKAFLRPGRFDRLVEVGVPDEADRREILDIHTSDMPLSFSDSYLDKLARETVGYTGADLKDVCMKANLQMQRRLQEDYPQYRSISSVLENESEAHTKEDLRRALGETQPTLLETYDVDVPNIGWSDVGGHNDVTRELRAAIEGPLEAPHLWSDREQATGILMYGPPGTGKTLLAKAMAGESNRTFIGVQSTELKSKYVGETERNIRRLFELARQLQPSIVYIDEIETIAKDRSSGSRGQEVQSAATSQLLSELDGIESRGDVIVVGSTNADYDPDIPLPQQEDVGFGLDPAMLRPGRLGSHFYIGLPDSDGRREVLDIHLSKVANSEAVALGSIDRDHIVEATKNMSGAEIEAVCWGAKEAARDALLGSRESYREIEEHELLYINDDHLTDAVRKFRREETR